MDSARRRRGPRRSGREAEGRRGRAPGGPVQKRNRPETFSAFKVSELSSFKVWNVYEGTKNNERHFFDEAYCEDRGSSTAFSDMSLLCIVLL